MMPEQGAELLRVRRQSPCPVCSKPDWCSVDADERFAVCMRVASDRRSRNGGFVHRLDGWRRVSETINTAEVPIVRIAPSDRDRAYRAVLERLTLSEEHADDLRRRGLSEETVVQNLYSTALDRAAMREIVAEVSTFIEMRGIPGFFLESGAWRLNLRDGDLIVPVRDAAGRIVGCQLRSELAVTRYRWLTSADKPMGTPATMLPHFALPYITERERFVIVTEGPIKADVVAERLHRGVVGLPGVSSFRDDFGQALRSWMPGLASVAVAYDADWRENPHVRTALCRLVRVLILAGFHVRVWGWDGALAKGLDDLLNAEATCDSSG